MYKIGLEKEFFVCNQKTNEPIVVPHTYPPIPHDSCGWLAEARGNPFNDVTEAVYSLKAAIHKLYARVQSYNDRLDFEKRIYLKDAPLLRVGREVRDRAQRTYEKGLIQHQNLYGHLYHMNRTTEATAGIHISFTKPLVLKKRTVNQMFDFVQIFRELDKVFADDIKMARRRPGFYEIKHDGRVEYRSLPSTVNLDVLIQELEDILG